MIRLGVIMYRIEKRFKFSMGHRLSKHKGPCFNIHGHNYNVLIGMMSPLLNTNDMVIDFGDLKVFIKAYLDEFDHCCMVNGRDTELLEAVSNLGVWYKSVPFEPTAEAMAKMIFLHISRNIPILRTDSENDQLMVDYVTVYETDDAKATYSRSK